MPDEPITEQAPKTDEELKARLAAEMQAEKEKGFEIKLSSGEVFKGANAEEVAQKLADSKLAATEAIRDRERQIRERDAELASLRSTQKPAPRGDNKFDTNKFYETLASDPASALDSYLAYRLGIPETEVADALAFQRDTVAVVSAHLETAKFNSRHPDAPAGNEFADTMISAMKESGRDWTADNLSLVYRDLVDAGKVKPVARQAAESPRPGNVAPDIGSSAPGGNNDLVGRFEQLSTEEMEKHLRSMNVLQ